MKGEELWLTRLVENLVDNAVQHGTEGAPIKIEIGRGGDRVVLDVQNAGEVQEHVKKKLFKRFISTRADRGGTGLGLAIVRAVAESHGGSIVCERHGPPFVTFRVQLPVARQSLLMPAVKSA